MSEYEPEIAFQQILLPDASVYSVQWVDLPFSAAKRATASFLLEYYFRVIRKLTLGVVRPAVSSSGVDFRLMGSRLALLSFEPARFEKDESADAVHLCICGGFLVQPGECDRGMFSLSAAAVDDGIRITAQLSDYCPLLLGSRAPSGTRKLLYGLTQSYIHKVVTVRYLSYLCRELTGRKGRITVKKVRVREGTDI